MKQWFLFLIMTLPLLADAQEGMTVEPSDILVERTGGSLVVSMKFDPSGVSLPSQASLRITPVVEGDDGKSLRLRGLTIAGRSRYYTLLREGYDESADGSIYRFSKTMSPVVYTSVVPYEDWMQGSTLNIDYRTEGCCSRSEGESLLALTGIEFSPRSYMAEYVFITPEAEAVKTRNIEGQAYVDFKVNQMTILPDFRRNPGELAKIRESIDAVRDNSDTRITALSITGYASPEGSYSNNERLAKGRTDALADYVKGLYRFPDGIIRTFFVAEDWEGLRRFLTENPEFENRDNILAIVDSSLAPDVKDARIKSDYPSAYRYLLENVYPGLRHSDYKVEYVVRSYTDPKEIAEVFRNRPGNLSLQELFVLAESLPEGSEEYADVFETAARLFPESKIAACNAGIAAIQRGDLIGAARYLEKAGDTREAVYSRGVLSAMNGDYASARRLLEKAKQMGMLQAENALRNLDAMEKKNITTTVSD